MVLGLFYSTNNLLDFGDIGLSTHPPMVTLLLHLHLFTLYRNIFLKP